MDHVVQAAVQRAFDGEDVELPTFFEDNDANAGVFGPGDIKRRIDHLSEEMWDNVQDTNCKGVFHGLQDFARAQREQPSDDPAVVVIKSIYGSGASLFGNATYRTLQVLCPRAREAGRDRALAARARSPPSR